MAEIVACPNCQRQLQIPESYAGKQVQCPDCKHIFETGSSAGMQSTPPAPKPSSAPRGGMKTTSTSARAAKAEAATTITKTATAPAGGEDATTMTTTTMTARAASAAITCRPTAAG